MRSEKSAPKQQLPVPAARLGLGTVQFGLDYGLPASGGQVSEADVGILLRDAYDAGIRLLDTAERYGEAEEVLGRALPDTGAFRIVTKTPVVADPEVSGGDVTAFKTALERSRQRLGVQSLHGVLVHAASDILKPGGERLIDALHDCRNAGWVQRVGVSVYDAAEIDGVLEHFTPDIVQLPFSIVDTRLSRSGHLAALKSLEVEIHARSLFLQGALLQEPDQLPDYFAPIRNKLKGLGQFVADIGMNRLQACLAFGYQHPELDHLIIGVKDRAQLTAAVDAMDFAATTDAGIGSWDLTDTRVLDPRQWPAGVQAHRGSS